ncbi:3-oxoadipate enol-lactone hydrolase (plasmid) [Rhizobium leguminosarum bv. trifolii CB782]|nr:3-oxoadipate enol-lactone hydrolase [Rhizobium leguminosarum bv. trifolii CB782]
MESVGTLKVGDVELAYRLDGKGGRSLICIHGVGSYKEAWKGVVDRFKGDFTVLTFDLRGHGASSRIKGRYEIEDFVRETIALADHVGFKTFSLAGFSLGGLIAQKLALAHPQRVERLILLSTVAGRTQEEKDRVAGRLTALMAGEPGSHYDASLSRWLTEEFQKNNPDKIARLRERNAENDPDCYAAAYRVLAETDLGEELSGIVVPTLVATGEGDSGSNPRMASFIHDRIANSQIKIFPGLRHSILTEAPELVASAIRDFLKRTEETHG